MTAATAPKGQLLDTTPSTKFAPIAAFRLADYLTLGTMIGSNRVTYVGPNFLKHFGEVEESNIPAVELKSYALNAWTLDQPVLDTLGVGEQEDPFLAHMIEVLKLGASGPGLFNGYSNLHYKRSPKDGRLWTPHWYMRGDRLGFGALPVGDVVGWEIGDRFYRV
jgi:hypothetical protein